MLIPEHVQTQCRGDVLAQSVGALLDDPERRSDVSAKLRAVTDHMRGEGGSPSANAAAAVLSLI